MQNGNSILESAMAWREANGSLAATKTLPQRAERLGEEKKRKDLRDLLESDRFDSICIC